MNEHIVKSYDEQLNILKNTIAKMGSLAEKQIKDATEAVLKQDQEFADAIVGKDDRIDDLEKSIEQQVVNLLTMRQPLAIDLRETVSAMKISSDLERIGDLSKNIAKRSRHLDQSILDDINKNFSAASIKVQKNVKLVLDAFLNRDAKLAEQVWYADEEIDSLVDICMNSILKCIEKYGEGGGAAACSQMMFMSKNLERIGDHATNIAETVYFLVTGDYLEGDRPKGESDIVSGQ
jgi:phosphate transport system protein